MRISRLAVLVAAAALFMSATATSAFSASSATVYGRATMTPTVSIALSGAGCSESIPLIYEGEAGTLASPKSGAIQVTNTGTAATALYLGLGSRPQSGAKSWSLGPSSAADQCAWFFTGQDGLNVFVPTDSPSRAKLWDSLSPGASHEFLSGVRLPSNYTDGDFAMTALITAGD